MKFGVLVAFPKVELAFASLPYNWYTDLFNCFLFFFLRGKTKYINCSVIDSKE